MVGRTTGLYLLLVMLLKTQGHLTKTHCLSKRLPAIQKHAAQRPQNYLLYGRLTRKRKTP